MGISISISISKKEKKGKKGGNVGNWEVLSWRGGFNKRYLILYCRIYREVGMGVGSWENTVWEKGFFFGFVRYVCTYV